MKKFLPFLMILMVLFAFVACDNGNGGGVSFDDCTEPATEVVLSDGNWTLKGIIDDTEAGMYMEQTLKATVEGGKRTFTSGSAKQTMDFAVMLQNSPEMIASMEQMSDDQKTETVFGESSDEMPENTTVTWDGLKATMKVPSFSEEELAEMQEGFDLSNLPEDAVIKTNADKTKYVIIIEDEDGYNEEYYISKD